MKCFESLGERCDVDVCVLQFTSCAQRPSSVPRKGRPGRLRHGPPLPQRASRLASRPPHTLLADVGDS